MLVKLAWRNVWRNKARSFVVMGAISIGLMGSIFFAAMMTGVAHRQLDMAIHNEVSHLQICHKDYPLSEEIKDNIENPEQKIAEISDIPQVEAAAYRLVVNGMAATATNSSGAKIIGIHPEQEQLLTGIHGLLQEGDYFKSKTRSAQILISRKMADRLKVKLKSKIILNFPAQNGNVAYGLFRVVGIFKTTNGMFDDMNVFVRQKDLAELLGLENEVATEIAILLKDDEFTANTKLELSKIFPNLLLRDWGELNPMIKMYSGITDQFNAILLGIILIALIFGIINTMLMVIMERTREIGMLRAIGMTKSKIVIMIILETVFLSVVGGAIGASIGAAMVSWLGKRGLNLEQWAEGFEEMGFSSVIYPELEVSFYVQMTVLVIITAIIASWFPARRAIKLNPATAIRDA